MDSTYHDTGGSTVIGRVGQVQCGPQPARFLQFWRTRGLPRVGWGVVTAGYGDLFKVTGVPNDEDSWFMATFSGTSNASPLVAGTVACLQERDT